MAYDFERKVSRGELTLKLYRGEGAALLAFDLDAEQATDDFVGFTIEVKYPGSQQWGALHNRIHFGYPEGPDRPRSYSSREAPIQKFRWIHVPTDLKEGDFRYRVTAKYMQADGSLRSGAQVEAAISLKPETINGFVNVGFTRGFASSQAYADRFHNEARILPPQGADAAAALDQDMAPFEKHYAWLGFEARRLVFQLLDEVIADPSLTLDALIYECKEPEFLERLETLGSRLRAVIDDHDEQGNPQSAESISARRLTESGAGVRRLHFGRQQHNKVLLVRRSGKPVKILTGSTNFSLRGFYIQANNALLFNDDNVASLYGAVFDAYWNEPGSFRKNPLSQQWLIPRSEPNSTFGFCFAPHAGSAVSLGPVARAIQEADSSVLYSVVFLNQLAGPVRDALSELMNRPLFSYGVTQRTAGLAVSKPDGARSLLPFAYLGEKSPEPFRAEWNGNTTGHSNMVHHKFVVTDFNGERPTVFTGSSNLAGGGEKENGDNLIYIEDRKVAVAYAIEALRMFDHFHFRVSMMEGDKEGVLVRLAKPPKPGQKPWFSSYYRKGHIKERDRKLFVK
ncbi:MAG: hypothetical protein V7642_5883 [Burkholderiales bacterium]